MSTKINQFNPINPVNGNNQNNEESNMLNNLVISQNEIPYPMVNEYSGDWNRWEIARELISNAIDSTNEGIKGIQVYIENDALIVEDRGDGILPKYLLLGKNHKTCIDPIGQFGEGLKLAILVCKKLNLNIKVYSHQYEYWNSEKMIEGESTLVIPFKRYQNSIFEGTKIIIENWHDITYLDRFLTSDDILYSNSNGGIVQNKPSGNMYLKTVFVQNNDDYALTWNLRNVTIVKGRSTLQENDINKNIGDIMSKCEDSLIWRKFFKAVNDGKKEKDIIFGHWQFTEKSTIAMIDAFKWVNGNKTVLGTTLDNMNDATHRGAEVIPESNFGYYLKEFLKEKIGTDASYVKAKLGVNYGRVTSHQINEVQKKNLGYARKICKRLGYDAKNLKIASHNMEHAGDFDPSTNIIQIQENQLFSLVKTMDVLIHELGHWYDQKENGSTCDNTDNHVNAITKITGMILAGYMDHNL